MTGDMNAGVDVRSSQSQFLKVVRSNIIANYLYALTFHGKVETYRLLPLEYLYGLTTRSANLWSVRSEDESKQLVN